MDHNAYYPKFGILLIMRTEEEAKYDLNEQIFELYDSGIPVQDISERLNTTVDYVSAVLNNVQVEAV